MYKVKANRKEQVTGRRPLHSQIVKRDQQRGILIPSSISITGQEIVVSMENRCTRKAVHRLPSRMYDPMAEAAKKNVYPKSAPPVKK